MLAIEEQLARIADAAMVTVSRSTGAPVNQHNYYILW